MKNLQLSDFPKSSLADWIKVAEKQLKKEDPIKELTWNTGGIEEVKPFYHSSDLEALSDQLTFFENLPPHRWKLYEEISVGEGTVSNQHALDALMGGCDGIIFSGADDYDPEVLMKGIDPSICDISILGTPNFSISNSMNMGNTVIESGPSESPVTQIASILGQLSNKQYIYRKAFNDFFLEVACVRALNYCISNEVEADHVEIHSQIALHEDPEFQWFVNTTAGLASILGGSHSIGMPTSIGDNRITRNVGNLIRDESKIETYSDQCGGSYYVESLTARIIELVKEHRK